jgi:hypothetical protein
MTQTEAMTLHEQARVLRTLASVADDPHIKHDLLKIAEKCEELVRAELTSTETQTGGGSRPSGL